MIINVKSQRINGTNTCPTEADSKTALISNRISHGHQTNNGGYLSTTYNNAENNNTNSGAGECNSFISGNGNNGGYRQELR